jgi:methionyl-tRNA formyltransferase
LRTVFLGTSQFAAEILDFLAQTPHRPELVVTRPDRPSGRGRKMARPPVAAIAEGRSIALDQPESVNDEAARARIASVAPDAVVVCAFGALIKEPLLSEHLMLNIHPSLLPRWRGAAPIERAIMAGDGVTGVSIMRLTAGLDSGPVCLVQEQPIGDKETYGTLADHLTSLAGPLIVEALDALPPCHEQDESAATYAEKITAEDRVLDARRPAVELERVVRALFPHIGAAIAGPDGERLGVWTATARPAQPGDPPAGELGLDGPLPTLGCTPGTLALTTVQPAGRRQMPGQAYLNGLRR